MSLSKYLLIAGLVVSSTAVTAHGIWLEQRRGNIDVIYGDGIADDPYKTNKFHSTQGFDTKGNPIAIDIVRLEDFVRLKPQQSPAVIASVFNNGKYAQTPDGAWHNQGRLQIPNAQIAMQVWKYNLTILKAGAEIPPLEDLKLAIIPDVDPLSVKPGSKITVTVLVDGKPAQGLKIIPDYRAAPKVTEGQTDVNGKAQITIRNHGLNVIATKYSDKVTGNPDIEERNLLATLTFVGGKAK